MKENILVFLDFDGVLNTEKYQRLLHDQGVQAYDEFGPLFDPEAVRNLQTVLDAVSGVRVIISSSWKIEGLSRIRKLWKARNLPGKVFGVTPDYVPDLLNVDLSNYDNLATLAGRGNEVKQWIEKHAPGGCRYVIFDDTPDFLPEQERHLIQTHPLVGITNENAIQAIKILRDE